MLFSICAEPLLEISCHLQESGPHERFIVICNYERKTVLQIITITSTV